jgi:CRISPR-associated protein Cas5d
LKGKTHVLTAWGDFACFTRPEAKVERLSYPVITPSAARGIFDAIYWKPDQSFYWQVEKIEILAEPRFIALRRNEVKNKADSESTILSWARGQTEPQPLWADGTTDSLGTDQKGRTQRQTMALKNARYRLSASMRSRNAQNLAAQDAQFERRVNSGKCVYQPYFGCREFACYFEPSCNLEAESPFPIDLDVGLMLYDVFDLGRQNNQHSKASVSLFRARVIGGVLDVPEYSSPLVLKGQEAV